MRGRSWVGYNVALSRRRSWVQVPSLPPFENKKADLERKRQIGFFVFNRLSDGTWRVTTTINESDLKELLDMGGKADALTSCHPGEELVSVMRTSDEKSHQDRSRHLDAKKKPWFYQSFFFAIFSSDGTFLSRFACANAYASAKAPLSVKSQSPSFLKKQFCVLLEYQYILKIYF